MSKCINNCNFYGSELTNNYCSKCFEELQKTEKTSAALSILKKEITDKQTNLKRCWKCNTKIGLTGFKCACDYVFCSKHRLPEEHECSFDYKSRDQSKISKNNPIIIAKKIEKI